MSLRRCFEGSLVLLILSGAAALSLAEGSPLPFLCLGVASMHQWSRGWRSTLSVRGVNLASTAALLFAFVDYTLITSWDFLLTLGRLVVVMQVVRIYQGWAEGGVWRITLLGFMQLVVAATIMVKGIFVLPFISFVLFAVLVLALHRLQEEAGRLDQIRACPGLVRRMALSSLLVLGTGIGIFIAVPRFGAGWFGHTRGRSVSMIGFGESIALDDIGRILDNPEVVMRVVSDPRTAAKYWRGKVFDTYDGKRWTLKGGRDLAYPEGNGRFLPLPSPGNHGGGGGDEVEQTFYVRPLKLKVIFACLDPVRVQFLSRPPRKLLVDKGGAMTTPRRWGSDIAYRVTSRVPNRSRARGVTLEAVRAGGPEPDRWLSLEPGQVNVPRLRALAEQIVGEAETPYECVLAVESHLRDSGEFRYTLDLPARRRKGQEPVEDFLFRRKEGHCEYYASSMVLLLRTLGIPCRLVTGFRAGEWNPVGAFYQVRQRHAHAWPEVYFGSDVGWVTMDPTPGGEAPTLASAFRSFGHLIDYLKYQWVTMVVTYNSRDQAGVLRWARDLLDRQTGRLERLLTTDLGGGVSAWAVGLLLIGGALMGLLLRRSVRGRGPPRMDRVRVRFYRDLLQLLSRRGFQRRRGETPMEFVRRVQLTGGSGWGPAIPVTEAYYRVRFGGYSLSPEEEARVRGEVARLRVGR